jgi:hypothetical protein
MRGSARWKGEPFSGAAQCALFAALEIEHDHSDVLDAQLGQVAVQRHRNRSARLVRLQLLRRRERCRTFERHGGIPVPEREGEGADVLQPVQLDVPFQAIEGGWHRLVRQHETPSARTDHRLGDGQGLIPDVGTPDDDGLRLAAELNEKPRRLRLPHMVGVTIAAQQQSLLDPALDPHFEDESAFELNAMVSRPA